MSVVPEVGQKGDSRRSSLFTSKVKDCHVERLVLSPRQDP